jgi:cell division protein FtsQ
MRTLEISANDRPVSDGRRPRPHRKTTGRSRHGLAGHMARLTVSLRIAALPVRYLRHMLRWRPAAQKNSRRSRRRSSGNWRPLALYGGVFMLFCLMVGVGGYYVVQHALIEKTLSWYQDRQHALLSFMGFTVQEISVSGRDKTSVAQLMDALDVRRGDSIFNVDLAEAKARVEHIGWVEKASVMRRLPDEIYVHITERRPFARWQKQGATSVIDRNGVVVAHDDPQEYRYLPRVVGNGANIEAAGLFDMLARTPGLFTRLQNAVRIRDRRWNLEFDNGVTILLPEVGIAAAWTRLNDLQASQHILNKEIMAIDLRLQDKMFVRIRPDDAELRRIADRKISEKET